MKQRKELLKANPAPCMQRKKITRSIFGLSAVPMHPRAVRPTDKIYTSCNMVHNGQLDIVQLLHLQAYLPAFDLADRAPDEWYDALEEDEKGQGKTDLRTGSGELLFHLVNSS